MAREVRSPPRISTELTRGRVSFQFTASAGVLRVKSTSSKGRSGSGIRGRPPTAMINPVKGTISLWSSTSRRSETSTPTTLWPQRSSMPFSL